MEFGNEEEIVMIITTEITAVAELCDSLSGLSVCSVV